MVYPWVAPGLGDQGERIRHEVATETKETREPGRLVNGGGESVEANASVGVPRPLGTGYTETRQTKQVWLHFVCVAGDSLRELGRTVLT